MDKPIEIEKVLQEMEEESINFWKEFDDLMNNIKQLDSSINDLTKIFIGIWKGE